MKDFIFFKRMISPYVLGALYWILVVVCVVAGVVFMFSGEEGAIWGGLAIVFLGPIGLRFYAEMMMVLFRIYEELRLLRLHEKKK